MSKQDSPAGFPSESKSVNEPTAIYHSTEAVDTRQTIDVNEEMKFAWQGLSDEQRKPMVDLMKEMLRHRRPDNIPHEEWEEMMKQRSGFLAGTAKTYTREEAREIVTNKDKRHEFLHCHK